MSRTDVHRPWRVQVADPYNRHKVVRYGGGPFDAWYYVSLCHCVMCAGDDRWSTRSERTAWRSIRAELMQLVDRSDVDVPPLRRNRYWMTLRYPGDE